MAIARRPLEAVKDVEVKDVKMEDVEWAVVPRVIPDQVPAFQFLKKGDTLIGVYQSVKADVGKNHSNLYTITEEPSGEEFVVWGCKVLDNRFASIPMGSLVKIVFEGRVTPPLPARPYNDYVVCVHK